MSKPDATRQLGSPLRWALALFGLLCIAGAAFLILVPPKRETIERVTSATDAKSVVSSADVTYTTITVFVSGVVLILYAANGVRFTRIVAGEYTADSEDPKALAQAYENDEQSASPVSVDVPEADAPQPTEAPKGIISNSQGESVAVYSLQDIPVTVVRDALGKWPQTVPLPSSLETLEFATRKTGKGNNPWTLKFKGSPPIIVAYGGKGKTSATVTTGS